MQKANIVYLRKNSLFVFIDREFEIIKKIHLYYYEKSRSKLTSIVVDNSFLYTSRWCIEKNMEEHSQIF